MIVLRHVIGDELRRRRLRQGRTLREVSTAARVSLGYLSEVERGQKEASSELLAAICGALEEPLSSVLASVSVQVAGLEAPPAAASVPPSLPRLPDLSGAVPAGRRPPGKVMAAA